MKNRMIGSDGNITVYNRVTDEKTSKRIEEHMTNINDKITEEDLKNIRTDIYDELLQPKEEEKEEEEEAGPKEKEEELTEKEQKAHEEAHKINSTWNILED